jgi:hypothetical protein
MKFPSLHQVRVGFAVGVFDYPILQTGSRNRLEIELAITGSRMTKVKMPGNGRIARQLSVFMALQAGMSLLDLANIKGKTQRSLLCRRKGGAGT